MTRIGVMYRERKRADAGGRRQRVGRSSIFSVLSWLVVACATPPPPATMRDGGTPPCVDTDGDTICDYHEGTDDLDGDGLPNDHDLDSDGDGVPDAVEAGDADPRTLPADHDGDGLADAYDPGYAPPFDGGVPPDAGAGPPPICSAAATVPTGCMPAFHEGEAGACNGLDDDCDGQVDEACPCEPGAVQRCFAGPPGRATTGACTAGAQVCLGGGEFEPGWGACEGGVLPELEVCDSLDNDCNGCRDDLPGCRPSIDCPGPDDPRVAPAQPFTPYALVGPAFFSGEALEWHWQVKGGPCDSISPRPSFSLTGASSPVATLVPALSGDYEVTLIVISATRERFSCSWVVHVAGPGLRVELCYREADRQDLDLFMSPHGFTGDWFTTTTDTFLPAPEVCGFHNCEGHVRGMFEDGSYYPRVDWGYAHSPLSACEAAPLGGAWTELGHCVNPRLDIDNNLVEARGVPENINIDAPRDGETFRVMVQNFTGRRATPVVNVYCGGGLAATYGATPDSVPAFMGTPGDMGIGAMWRVADITTHVDGDTTTCELAPLHPPGETTGYDVTYDDPRF